MLVHVVAQDSVVFGTPAQEALHRGATQVKVAVAQALLLARLNAVVVSIDGKRLRTVEELKIGHHDFNSAGRKVGVD